MASRIELARVVELLGLEPHPEGGFFRETHRSADAIPGGALDARYGGAARSASTAIHYLVTPESFSAMHRVASEEVFHFYLGDPVEMFRILPDGRGETVRIGPDLERGERPQVVVPAGAWQGTRLVEGGSYALLGATVAPGFEYADFEMGRRDELIAMYPEHAERIRFLTR